jgi:hypothetical protein
MRIMLWRYLRAHSDVPIPVSTDSERCLHSATAAAASGLRSRSRLPRNSPAKCLALRTGLTQSAIAFENWSTLVRGSQFALCGIETITGLRGRAKYVNRPRMSGIGLYCKYSKRARSQYECEEIECADFLR